MRAYVRGIVAATGIVLGAAPGGEMRAFAQSEPAIEPAARALIAPDGVAGPYLGAVAAELSGDIAASARLYNQAVSRDPTLTELRRRALWHSVLAGNVEAALEHGAQLLPALDGDNSVQIVVAVEEVRAGAFPQTVDRLTARDDILGPVLSELVQGWALSVDDLDAADAVFDGMEGAPYIRALAEFHAAMAHAVAGDLENAAIRLEAANPDILRIDSRFVLGTAEVWATTGRQGKALEILDAALADGLRDPILAALRDRIAAGETIGFSFLPNATEGVAEAFYGFARLIALSGENRRFPLFLTRLALHLAPQHDEARLLTAEILDAAGQYELAIDVLGEIPVASPRFVEAETRRANAMQAAGRTEEAIGALTALTRVHPENFTAHLALADAMRREERWAPAAETYSMAIDLLGDGVAERHWLLFFRRGMSYERSGDWPPAEADFRRALELQPDQPHVLNYLGYSLVELGRNYEEAEQMIRTAVRLRPEDGYITDSLAWVLYRMGRFEEAVAPMERAVAFVPFDPILNDHLGDILWMVGRKTEARFQWKRALSFEPEEKDLPRIQRKLEVGLDVVLDEEAQAPEPVAETEQTE